jgi:hypothetical protein
MGVCLQVGWAIAMAVRTAPYKLGLGLETIGWQQAERGCPDKTVFQPCWALFANGFFWGGGGCSGQEFWHVQLRAKGTNEDIKLTLFVVQDSENRSLRKAWRLLNNALPNLWLWLAYSEVPRTTNSLEGGME